MKGRKHTPDQIIRKLREADRLLGEGREVAEVAKHLEVSEATLARWRAQYGGLKADDAKLLKELQRENGRLKRIAADKELEIDALREISKGNFWARRGAGPRSGCCRTARGCRSGGHAGSSVSIGRRNDTRSRRRPLIHGCVRRCGPSPASILGGVIGWPGVTCAIRVGW